MVKVLFICYGNICRSTMAEFLFKKFVEEKGKSQEFYIESAGTSSEEAGSPVHVGTRKILDRFNIDYSKKRARKIVKEDYDKFDYIIGMDEKNVRDAIRFFGGDDKGKIGKILDFTKVPRDVIDPWWAWAMDGVGNFEDTYNDITLGINGFWEYLTKSSNLG